ncbi:MAG: hypothetical protein J5622_02565 [Firmicutes bacterium]|nr:hypothetical protein [Bacillota bacterium]
MTNESLYKIIQTVLENKSEIVRLADYLDPAELGRGVAAIPEELVNAGLRPYIMKLSPMINDYKVNFSGGSITLLGEAEVPKVGAVKLNYLLTVNELTFGANGHRLIASFSEQAEATGAMGKMALSALKLKGPLIGTAAQLAKAKLGNSIYVSGNSLAVDIDALPIAEKIPKELNLQYISSENGQLKLKYWLD